MPTVVMLARLACALAKARAVALTASRPTLLLIAKALAADTTL